MTLEGLTYGNNDSDKQLSIPIVPYIQNGMNQLVSISLLLKSFESNEFLINAEKEAKQYLNGNDTSRVPG